MRFTSPPILIACVLGSLLVVGAFWLRYTSTPTHQSPAGSVSIQRDYIPVVDSDADGIPDWQAALLSGPPIIYDASTTDYVLPDTLSAQFSVSFMREIMTAYENGLLNATQNELVNNALRRLEQAIAQDYYDMDVLTLTATYDQATVRAYGIAVADAIIRHTTGEAHELTIIADIISNDDQERLPELTPIISRYEALIADLLAIPVPTLMAREHIDLVNTLLIQKSNVAALQKYFEDPLYAYLHYQRMPSDLTTLEKAITGLYRALYLEYDIRYGANESPQKLIVYETR